MSNRPSVDPAFTFGVSLVISLVLWYPTMRGAMAGTIDITDAGIRYFVALAIAWAGTYGVSAMVAVYAAQPRRHDPPPRPAAEHPVRRADDTATAQESETTAA